MRPTWDKYFMEIAEIVKKRSTCIRRQVGAVIVKDKQILATGYNGAPKKLKHCEEIGCKREQLKIPSGQRHELCRALHSRRTAKNPFSSAISIGKLSSPIFTETFAAFGRNAWIRSPSFITCSPKSRPGSLASEYTSSSIPAQSIRSYKIFSMSTPPVVFQCRFPAWSTKTCPFLEFSAAADICFLMSEAIFFLTIF